MVSERLSNITNYPLVSLVSKLISNLTFYRVFLLGEVANATSKAFFVWKSANFADSYWFIYNDKLNLHETNTFK